MLSLHTNEAINRILLKNILNLSIEETLKISHPNNACYKIENWVCYHKKFDSKKWEKGIINK